MLRSPDGELRSRGLCKFDAEKLTLIPSNRCGDPELRLALSRQRQCQLITGRQRQIADYAGADARKVLHPAGAGLILPEQLAMYGYDHVVSGNPSLLVKLSR